ncbi:unnamed protein product [Camellia sinensis]
MSTWLSSSLLAEARALLEAIKWAITKKIKCLSIFTDCKVLVDSCEQKRCFDWEVDLVVQDILMLSSAFQFLCVTKVDRVLVEPAHNLAKSVTILSYD